MELCPTYFLILLFFLLGYAAIIFEINLRVNKSAAALSTAVVLWVLYFYCHAQPLESDLGVLGHHVGQIAQILFFLLGAMTIVELVDSHHGFKMVTDFIHTTSKRKMLWMIALLTFFLSAILDNLTTTILMISLLRKLIPDKKERLLFACIVVTAANAGGAWTPIGDVTTTMLWIDGQLSSVSVMKALFIPSMVSILVPLAYFTFRLKGRFSKIEQTAKQGVQERGANLVFFLGVGGLVFVPIFKALTGLPPFMGILLSLAVLWVATDILHHGADKRSHLRVPHIFTKIDISAVLFFLGILLAVSALETAGILKDFATLLQDKIQNLPAIATFIGILSAIVDNVPLVAATMGMYPTSQYPMDNTLWHMIAYAAGTGGSILIIGSAAGVALMGMEKIDFVTYLKKASLPVAVGYFAGMAAYLLLYTQGN